MIAKANQPQPLIDLEAEGNLLAAMIERPSVIDEVSRLIDATAFSDSDNAALFDSLRLLHEAGKPIGDASILCRSLTDAGCNWTAGDLLVLMRDHFTSEPAYEAGRLARLAKLRRMQSALESTAARCGEHGADPDSISRDLADKLLADDSHQLAEVESVYEIGERVLRSIANRDKSRGIMLGLQALDEAIGVVCPGEMIVLAARPGVGKSALAMQFASANAKTGRDVLFVSLEMTGDELTQRLLCSFAGVNQADLRTGSVPTPPGRIETSSCRVAPRTANMGTGQRDDGRTPRHCPA